MTSTRRTKSGIPSPALKQSTLLFQSTKPTNSQNTAKGKKPARTESAPVTQIKRQLSDIEISSNSSESSSDEDMVQMPKRRKVENTPVVPVVVEKKPLERLNPNDRKWGKQFSFVREKMGGIPAGECLAAHKREHFPDLLVIVHGENQTKVDHILRVFDLYVPFTRFSSLVSYLFTGPMSMVPVSVQTA